MKIIRLLRLPFLAGILAIALVLSSCGVPNEGTSQPAAVDDMIKAFSSGCNIGEWTHAAIDRSNSIVAMYESLRQKASCKEDSGLLDSALHSSLALQAELRSMTQDAAISRERKMDDAANDLLITIKNFDSSGIPIDADLRDSLVGYYSSARYEQSLAKADVNYIRNPSYKSKFSYGMVRVNQHMRSLLAVSDKLSSCYSRNPSVAVELGASIAELVGTFASPAIGLGVSALSKLMQFGVVASRTMPPAESIYKTNKNKMPTALQCGLEALSRDYCKAKDAALLVSLSTKEAEKNETAPFFVGVEVLDRYLPSLNAWLDRVVNGSDISSEPDLANKINFQFERYNTAGAMKRLSDSYAIDTAKKISGAATADGKISQIRFGIRNLIGSYFYNMGGTDPASPSNGPFYGFETAPSFLLKLIAPKELKNPNATGTVFDKINDANLDAGDWPMIVGNLERMYKERYLDVVNEFNEKVNVNISGLVRDATTKSKDEEISPVEALQRIFYFFDHYKYDSCNASRDKIIIEQFRNRISKVYQQLADFNSVNDEPQEIPCPPEGKKNSRSGGALPAPPSLEPQKKCYDLSPAKKTIALAFEAFKLDKNNVFLPGAMSKLVNTDLTARYLNGEGPKDIDELYRLAKNDMDLLFKRMKLTPALVRADTENARQISSDNLKEFRNRFLPSIKMAMQDLKKTADENKEPEAGEINSPYRNVLSRLCILTLVTGTDWPKDLDPALCMDAKIASNEAKLTVKFKDLKEKLEGKSFADRVCAYEEFLRFDRLANAEFKNPRRPNKKDESCTSNSFGFATLLSEKIPTTENAAFWQNLILKH